MNVKGEGEKTETLLVAHVNLFELEFYMAFADEVMYMYIIPWCT